MSMFRPNSGEYVSDNDFTRWGFPYVQSTNRGALIAYHIYTYSLTLKILLPKLLKSAKKLTTVKSYLCYGWRRSIVVRTLVSAGELSLSCARLLAGWVTTLWLSRPLSVSQHGQLSHPPLGTWITGWRPGVADWGVVRLAAKLRVQSPLRRQWAPLACAAVL